MKKQLILVFFLLEFFTTSYTLAQTNVGGGVFASTTWLKTNSPYIVTSSIVIYPSAALTIEPGVVVRFSDNTNLEVRGKLIAKGTKEDTIIFTSNSTTPKAAIWGGIAATYSSSPVYTKDQIYMEYCKGNYANIFLNLGSAMYGPYTFNHCSFFMNDRVMYDVGKGGTYFKHCKFERNGSGLVRTTLLFDGARVSHSSFINNEIGTHFFGDVDSCYFSGNTTVAAHLSSEGKARGNLIEKNQIGVIGVCIDFSNNIVQNNAIGIEVRNYSKGWKFEKNSICNNTVFNIDNTGFNDAHASNNCFCLNDSLSISKTIRDGYDDATHGLIHFVPFNNCGINSVFEESNLPGVRVVPNPFNSSTSITFSPQGKSSQLFVFNSLMQLVYAADEREAGTFSIAPNLHEGVYFYVIKNANEIIGKGKLVKE